jgi:hypothetical protein
LGKAAAALAEARKLKDLPAGRFPVTPARDWISTDLSHLQRAREVVTLLEHQAQLQSQDGAADTALETSRAILNCARSMGDEPSLMAILVRFAGRAIACGSMERTLAQGEPSASLLLTLQRLLEQEEAEPLVLRGIRGERAGLDRMVAATQAGECPLDQVRSGRKLAAAMSGTDSPTSTPLKEGLVSSSLGLKHQRAALLRYMNRVVEAAKLPGPQQVERLQALEMDMSQEPVLVQELAGAFSRVATAGQRSLAHVRCTIAALAAERYRRERGTWPKAPAELVASGHLKAWPEDPYDGKPLRWRRPKDGIVIYSLGPDLTDNGGKLRYGPNDIPQDPDGQGGLDIGFRLWDVAHRRQPPRPPRPKPPGAPDEEPGAIPDEKGP